MSQDFLVRSVHGISLPGLLVPFSVSRGDEFQGIMAGWLTAPQLVRMLRWQCRPYELRIGIGLGTQEGDLGTDPWKLTGPAFFKARQALEEAADSRKPATRIATGLPGLDELVNSAWLMLNTVMSRWTQGQWEAVMAYEEAGTLAAAAKILGVAPQNVQKRCRAAHWSSVRRAERGLSGLEQLGLPLSGENHKNTQNQVRREDQ